MAIADGNRVANSLYPKTLYDPAISQKCNGGFLCGQLHSKSGIRY